MPKRPDWIHCVTDTDNQGKALCGRDIAFYEFCFQDAKHARDTVTFGSRLESCGKCKKIMNKCVGG